jgi:hypothetical protein
MFRRGGSSQGTGITSGLGRQNFQGKGAGQTTPNPELDRQKAIIDYVSKLKQQAQPTTRQRIGDFLTAFGASAAPPGQLQTVGGALGSAAKGYAQLSAAREERAQKYGLALDQKLLEMFGGDKESLNSFLKTVKARAENEVVKGTYPDYDTAYKAVFDEVYNDMYKGQRKEKSFYDLVEDRAKIYLNNDELKTFDQARNYAEVRIKIEKGDIKVDKIPIGAIGTSKSGVSDITITNDGKAAGPNTNKPGYKKNLFANKYKVNENYVDPITKSVFKYQGGGMFKRVYP